MKRKLVSLLLVLASCSQEQAGHEPEAPVNISIAKTENVPVYIESIGTIESINSIDVKAEVSGQLVEVHVKEGQFVKQGDLLFTIDKRPFEAALDKALGSLEKNKSQLELAKIKLDRNKELVEKEFISKVTYDELKTQVASAEAQIKIDEGEIIQAQINLEHTMITAFTDGKIGQINYDPGNIVGPENSEPLTTIQEINKVYATFTVPQKYFYELMSAYKKESLPVNILLPGGKIIGKGHVVFIDNKVDTKTGTILLKAEALNQEHHMWPGQFVRVQLILKTLENAVVIPESAIQRGQDSYFTFVVKDDMTAELRQVKPGEEFEGQKVITEGIKPGEKVVVRGQLNLRPGSKVKVVEER